MIEEDVKTDVSKIVSKIYEAISFNREDEVISSLVYVLASVVIANSEAALVDLRFATVIGLLNKYIDHYKKSGQPDIEDEAIEALIRRVKGEEK